jgi:AraC-like DNA-binding protein
MPARMHWPRPPLDGFVECLWEFDAHAVPHQRERALPTGTVELVISLGDDRMRLFRDDADQAGVQVRGSVICGAHSGYFVLDTSNPQPVIGVHFRPGGAAALFGGATQELTDRHTGLEDIWGAAAGQLRERLLEAATPAARFAILEGALLSRLRYPFLHPAVAHGLRQLSAMPALARIRDLESETGYAPKRFIELFRNSVGLTPKVYSRIQRFQSVIGRLTRGQRVDWAAVAIDGGYCDQSHLNREFRAFSGLTPAEYLPVSTGRPSHVAVVD